MKSFLLKNTAVLVFLVCSVALHAQIISSDNLAIYPAAQASFNPSGKFVALGESGGVVGPTANGCNAYGFRAQIPSFIQTIPPTIPPISVSLGVETIPSSPPFFFPTIVPTLTVSAGGLLIKEQNNNSASGCGTLLGSFNEVTSSNNVFTILGSATATGGSWNPSDRTLKRNIETIENPMDIIKGLTGYTYEFRTEERPELRLPTGLQYGFITQEVQQVMPTAVREADGIGDKPLGFQVMNYNAIMPVMAEAIKQQDGTITALEQKNADLEQKNQELEARLARLEALLLKEGASSAAQPSNTMGAFDAVRLGQNRPNPSDGSTAIDYTLPSNMTNAFLVVVDINGRQISNQAITDAKGMVELNTSTWSAGTYIYSIVVDGKTLARKKMLVQ